MNSLLFIESGEKKRKDNNIAVHKGSFCDSSINLILLLIDEYQKALIPKFYSRFSTTKLPLWTYNMYTQISKVIL